MPRPRMSNLAMIVSDTMQSRGASARASRSHVE